MTRTRILTQWGQIAVFVVSMAGLSTDAVPAASEPDRVQIAVDALKRLKGVDLEANPALKAAVLKVLDSTRGTPQFVELVREFKLKGQSSALLEYAIQHPGDATGVDALQQVLANGDLELLRQALKTRDAPHLVELLGNTNEREVIPLLEQLFLDPQRDLTLRQQALRGLARTLPGAEFLLDLAKKHDLSVEFKAVAAIELRNARWPQVKAAAADLLMEGPTAAPLPSISELAKLKGDIARGAAVFQKETVGCYKCHQIHNHGTDFGPNLSEIGSKLAKEAIYEAILDPSAGISFGYEAWQIELKNGDEAFGLLASETLDELAIKAQNGIVTRYSKKVIASRVQQKTSVMPSGLEQTMSQQDLVDLVQYLVSLKKLELAR